MSTVGELVNRKKKEINDRISAYERQEKNRMKREQSKQFAAEIDYIIRQFEFNAFKLKSSKKKVADFIVDRDGWIFITHAGGLKQEMKEHPYIEIPPYLGSIKFEIDNEDDDGNTSINRSQKFKKWREALEKKFDIDISIRREFVYKDRYDNDGYATYPDMIFQGVIAIVSVKE